MLNPFAKPINIVHIPSLWSVIWWRWVEYWNTHTAACEHKCYFINIRPKLSLLSLEFSEIRYKCHVTVKCKSNPHMWKCIFPRKSCIKITFADIFGTILCCTGCMKKYAERKTDSPTRHAWRGGGRWTGLGKRGIEVIGMPTDSNWNTLMCGKLTDIEEGNKMNAHLH